MAHPTFLSQTLFCFTLVVFVLGNKNGVTKQVTSVTKSLYFPEFSVSSNPKIDHEVKLLGSAKLSEDKRSIQIPDTSETDDIRHQAGRAIYSSPIRVFDPNSKTPGSFDTTFAFQFNNHTLPGHAENSGEVTQGGSGLTFLIAPDEFTVGRPGPWLGMLNDACDENYYKFFAIEFDTRQNPEFGDPNDNHIGINLGSIISNSTINASDYGLAFEDGSVHHARIMYDGSNKRMDIRVGSNLETSLKSVFSDDIDLSPFLNEYMFVGFSASTGNKTQVHNILSWNFTSKTPSNLRFPGAKTCESKLLVGRDRVEENSSLPIKEEKPTTTFLIFVCVVLLCFAIFVTLYCNSNRPTSDSGSTFLKMPEKKHRPRPPNKPRRFTGPELSLATKGFSEWEVLGSDLSGVLFKGTLPNGCHVAVKRFSVQFLSTLSIDRRRFLKRVGPLSRVRHPGLVPIRGWCYDHKELMVVYEYIFNGCLDKWLFGVGVLPWSRRFKVVKNIANGLNHLHSHQLAHCNVQASSVFLDVSFKALLGDFGLGDPVDIDPAYSKSVDVFNYGILVLEVVAGRKRWMAENEMDSTTSRRSSDDYAMQKMDLVDYAWIMHEKDEKVKMVDRRMGSGIDSEQAVRVINIALLCTLPESNGRPNMQEIVTFLTTIGSLPELPTNRPIVLFPYNSGPKLCGGYACAPFK